jgi:taurine dioxygenase
VNKQSQCEIRALSEHTGVEVLGLDLKSPIDAPLLEKLIQAFVKHSVLVVRKQDLEPAQLLHTVQLFGQVFTQHNSKFALPECPQIHYLSNQDSYPGGKRYIPGAGYHTDHSNALIPPKATVLHAIALPNSGGDTQYVNMHAAYDGLDASMRERLHGLYAIHVYQSRHSERKLIGLSAAQQNSLAAEVRHPLVRTHPESGRKSLYINPIRIERIEGMEDSAALELLDQLIAHATQPRYEYRHRWQSGDLVMWDNRCLLHKANGDYDMAQLRYLLRVMLQGDKPV